MPSKKRRYAVVGPGAVGGFYGALLARAGHDVHFLFHTAYEHVVHHGLTIESKDGDFKLDSISAYNDARAMPACDVVIVALKTTQNHLLPHILPHILADKAAILLLQNGLGQEERIAAIPGVRTVVAGLCFVCSTVLGPGHIRHLDYGRMQLSQFKTAGEPAGITPLMHELASDLHTAGIPVQLSQDLVLQRWKKLVWNVPFSGLSVVLNADTSRLAADPHARRLSRSLMQEIIRGAASQKKRIAKHFVEEMLADTDSMKPYYPSMKIDFDSGRELEIDSMFGVPIERAKQAGTEMPGVSMLYDQLRFMVQRRDRDRSSVT